MKHKRTMKDLLTYMASIRWTGTVLILIKLWVHREDTVSVAKSYTYDDGCEPCGTDTFMREPFVVMFSPTHAGEVNGEKKDPALSLGKWSSYCLWRFSLSHPGHLQVGRLSWSNWTCTCDRDSRTSPSCPNLTLLPAVLIHRRIKRDPEVAE